MCIHIQTQQATNLNSLTSNGAKASTMCQPALSIATGTCSHVAAAEMAAHRWMDGWMQGTDTSPSDLHVSLVSPCPQHTRQQAENRERRQARDKYAATLIFSPQACGRRNWTHLFEREASQQRGVVEMVLRVQQQLRGTAAFFPIYVTAGGNDAARQPHQALHLGVERCGDG